MEEDLRITANVDKLPWWLNVESLKSYPDCEVVCSDGVKFNVSKLLLISFSPVLEKALVNAPEEVQVFLDIPSYVMHILLSLATTGQLQGGQGDKSMVLQSLAYLGLSSLFASCSDVLEKEPFGQNNETVTFTPEIEVRLSEDSEDGDSDQQVDFDSEGSHDGVRFASIFMKCIIYI